MALFKKDKEKEQEVKTDNSAVVSTEEKETGVKEKESAGIGDMYWVLKRPHITEKSTDLSLQNAYVFEVDNKANKNEIKKAVTQIYKVTPLKVRTINEPSKTVRTRKGMGVRTRGKKAIVYLKEGDKIEFI